MVAPLGRTEGEDLRKCLGDVLTLQCGQGRKGGLPGCFAGPHELRVCRQESHGCVDALPRQRGRTLVANRVQVGRQRGVACGGEPTSDVFNVVVQTKGVVDEKDGRHGLPGVLWQRQVAAVLAEAHRLGDDRHDGTSVIDRKKRWAGVSPAHTAETHEPTHSYLSHSDLSRNRAPRTRAMHEAAALIAGLVAASQ